jgi:hypothetical protein
MDEEPRARVFISCGQRPELGELALARRVKAAIEEEEFSGRHFDPYIAKDDQALVGAKENLFAKLDQFEYYLFIDFKRERIERWCETCSEGLRPPKRLPHRHRGSLFTHQELALASFFGLDALIFTEEGVDTKDGVLNYLQSNRELHMFKSREDLPEKVLEAIRTKVQRREWRVSWRRGFSLSRNSAEFTDALFQAALRARYYHFSAVNDHWQVVASDCRAFLESWARVGTDSENTMHRPPPTELKFRGVVSDSVSIAPGPLQAREVDALYIFDDHPTVAFIGINPFIVDSGEVRQKYTIEGPGEFDLKFRLQSRELPPASLTLRLVLGKTLADARLFNTEADDNGEGKSRVHVPLVPWGGGLSMAPSTASTSSTVYGTVVAQPSGIIIQRE